MSDSPSRPGSGASSSSPKATLTPTDSQGRRSPWRHHQRASSTNRIVKQTSNARAEYTNSEEDGASQRQINQYLIKQEIGRGSFGAVHLAVDQYGEEYAVKEFSKSRLRKRAMSELLRRKRQGSNYEPFPAMRRDKPKSRLADTESSFDLIKEEIAIMKKLNHVNLVSLVEVLDDPDEDSLYMVLEYCKKGVIMKVDLEEDAEPYSEDDCRCWFRDLILGIEYLHAQGVIHRDIKPDNLLLTEDDTLKIVDFGVSEMFERTSAMRIAKSAGSPAFMAPELVSSERTDVMGQPADIWSMGVTLYCLRYGCVPFRKMNVVDLYDSISNDKVNLESEENKDFRDLMTRLLEKDPNKRITMQVLREHPWVTNHDDDPLMPSNENCAEIIAVPTEEEKNDAITGSLGRTLAVLKAVNRFKILIAKKRPYLIDSLFGPGSQMSRDVQGMIDNRRSAGRVLHSIFSSQSSAGGDEDGNSNNKDISSRSGVHSPESDHDKPETHKPPRRQESGRGQAQDPTETHLFFEIGVGPVELRREDGDSGRLGTFVEQPYVISESPPSAGYNIYSNAYNGEVRRIRRTKGQNTVLYLTRRVEGSGEISHAPIAEGYEDSGTPSLPKTGRGGKSKLAELFGKAAGMEKKPAGEQSQSQSQESKGEAKTDTKVDTKADTTTDTTADTKAETKTETKADTQANTKTKPDDESRNQP
jgi:[calcium/calmodulin-dependent protein kinase] kinase